MIDIGSRIHQLRIKNDFTLEELASRTELTKGFLSQLEHNLTYPSLSTLDDIANALGVSLSRFFAEEKEGKIVFTKEDSFVDQSDGVTTHWIVPNAQKNEMEPIIVTIEPGAKSKEIEPHQGQEFGHVLSGRVYLIRESNRKGILLKKGDSFYISGGESHHLENRHKQDCEVLWISTPPEF